MAPSDELKSRVLAVLNTLPEEALDEVADYLDYLQYKLGRRPLRETPFKPVALGSLWKGVTVTDEDIAEARHEMWGNFGEREKMAVVTRAIVCVLDLPIGTG